MTRPELASSVAAAAHAAPDCLCILDLGDPAKPRFVYGNLAFARLTGYSEAGLLTQDADTVLRVEGASWNVEALTARFERRPEIVVLARDGTRASVRVTKITTHDCVASIWIHPQEPSDLLLAALDSLDEIVTLFDADDRLVASNFASQELDRPVAALREPGTPYVDYLRGGLAAGVFPEAVGREAEWLAWRLAYRRAPVGSIEVARQGGRRVRVTERRLADGGTISIAADLTDLKKAQEALAQSEQRFRGLVECSLQGVIVHCGNRPLFANQAFAEIFGYGSPEEIMRLSSIDAYVAPADLARTRGYRRARLGAGHAPQDYDFRGLRKDGGEIWVNCRPAVITWNGLPAIQSVVFDVTARHEAQEAARIAMEEACAAAQIKSQFLATVSHEIRTPMNSVVGMADLLLRSALDPRQTEYAGTIRDAARHLTAIIDDLLDLSRLEAGKLELRQEIFDPRDIVQGVVGLLQPTAKDKGIVLTSAVPDDVPLTLVGDAVRFRQILVNLVANALKFTERGAVAIRLARIAGGDDGIVELRGEVRDTGIGIDAKIQERLFQPFTQADSSTTRHYGGSGLGLAICRQLCGLMGGEIGVDSCPGEGATFWFTIRCERHEMPELQASAGKTA